MGVTGLHLWANEYRATSLRAAPYSAFFMFAAVHAGDVRSVLCTLPRLACSLAVSYGNPHHTPPHHSHLISAVPSLAIVCRRVLHRRHHLRLLLSHGNEGGGAGRRTRATWAAVA